MKQETSQITPLLMTEISYYKLQLLIKGKLCNILSKDSLKSLKLLRLSKFYQFFKIIGSINKKNTRKNYGLKLKTWYTKNFSVTDRPTESYTTARMQFSFLSKIF